MNIKTVVFRCLDCYQRPLFCAQCVTGAHSLKPFHRVEHWRETHFEPTSLASAGLKLFLGHSGHRCPNQPANPTHMRVPRQQSGIEKWTFPSFASEEEADGPDDDINYDPMEARSTPLRGVVQLMSIGHENGFHQFYVVPCCCAPNSYALWEQLLDAGMMPATFRSPATAFTFEALDKCRLQTLTLAASISGCHALLVDQTPEQHGVRIPVSAVSILPPLPVKFDLSLFAPFRIKSKSLQEYCANGATAKHFLNSDLGW